MCLWKVIDKAEGAIPLSKEKNGKWTVVEYFEKSQIYNSGKYIFAECQTRIQ